MEKDITIPQSEYDQLKRDSENLQTLLSEKYDIMEYFPFEGGYKKRFYVSKDNEALIQVLKDLHQSYENMKIILKDKYPDLKGLI